MLLLPFTPREMYSVFIVLFFVAFQAICNGAPNGEFNSAADSIEDVHRVVKRAVTCLPDQKDQLDCPIYMRMGICNVPIDQFPQVVEFARTVCPITCGFCVPPPPTTMPPPTTSPAVCTPDKLQASLCAVYKNRFGFCETLRQFMMTNCFTTCGFCQPATTTLPPPTTSPAVNGDWSEWGDWSVCNVSCGSGQQMRRRTCNNPPPSGGGADCVGSNNETQSCNTNPCPGFGGWSNWGNWTPCTASCGVGIQGRIRSCTNPPPTIPEGGCPGDFFEIRSCNTSGCAGPTTPAISTSAPATPGPITPAPITPSPITPSPITPSPITRSPLSAADASCLKAHNDKRAIHGSPPLTWNATLAEHALNWADRLYRLGSLVHEQNIDEGENLYLFEGPTAKTCVDAVELWYAEMSQYDYSSPGFSPNTAHFTQVVWKATTQVGAGVVTEVNAQTGQLENYIVARYTPPGNVLGEFEENVVAAGIIDA